MFLGTPRIWWIAAAVPFVLSLVLLATGDGTMLRTAAAVVLLLLAMVLFGMAPMRYGESARTRRSVPLKRPQPPQSPPVTDPNPGPRWKGEMPPRCRGNRRRCPCVWSCLRQLPVSAHPASRSVSSHCRGIRARVNTETGHRVRCYSDRRPWIGRLRTSQARAMKRRSSVCCAHRSVRSCSSSSC